MHRLFSVDVSRYAPKEREVCCSTASSASRFHALCSAPALPWEMAQSGLGHDFCWPFLEKPLVSRRRRVVLQVAAAETLK